VTKSPHERARVLVVDDSEQYLRAAAEVVRRTPGFKLAGVAGCGAEAVELNAALAPDLVLLDIRMQGIDGVETTRRMRAARPDVVVFLVSAWSGRDLPADAHHCGAAAILQKRDLGPATLVELWRAHGPIRTELSGA
jgi:DNA-binding NarL/FixJ family response regulator